MGPGRCVSANLEPPTSAAAPSKSISAGSQSSSTARLSNPETNINRNNTMDLKNRIPLRDEDREPEYADEFEDDPSGCINLMIAALILTGTVALASVAMLV